MAARQISVDHSDEVRKRIQTSQLVNRLEDHVFNNLKLQKTQIDAIKILLSKTLPDLSAVAVGNMGASEKQKVFGWKPIQK